MYYVSVFETKKEIPEFTMSPSGLLQSAAGISGMWSLAAFAIAALTSYVNGRRQEPSTAAWAIVAAVLLLGLTPIVGSLYVQNARNQAEVHLKDLYRVRVVVLDPHEMAADDARVWSDRGGEPKRVEGGWQFDIPSSMRGLVTFYASKESAHLTGKTSLDLSSDYNPTATVHLRHSTNATIRGAIVDAHQNHVTGVFVEVVGYGTEGVTTKEDGGFLLAAHCADGEDVQLHAQKPGYKATYLTHSAGDNPATIIMDR